MNNFKLQIYIEMLLHKIPQRFKTAYFPFVMVLMGLIVGCSLLNWILFIRSNTLIMHPVLVFIGAPAILSGLAVLYWLRPRFKKLTYAGLTDEKHVDNTLLFHLVAVILLTTVSYYSQNLLEDTLTKVVKLHDIAEIHDPRKFKFYSVQDYIVKKDLYGSFFSIITHAHQNRFGQSRPTYEMDLFFVFPVFTKTKQIPVVWVGVHYNDSIESSREKGSLERAEKKFVAEAVKKTQEMTLDKFYYLESLTDNFEIVGFDNAISNSPIKLTQARLVLLGAYKPLKDKVDEDFSYFIASLLISLSIWFVVVCLWATDQDL